MLYEVITGEHPRQDVVVAVLGHQQVGVGRLETLRELPEKLLPVFPKQFVGFPLV